MDDFGNIDFQEYDDDGYLLNVEGSVPPLNEIRCDEQKSGTFEFDLWKDYDNQESPDAVGSGTISVSRRYIDESEDDYELIDIWFDEITTDVVGTELTEEQQTEVAKKVADAIEYRFKYVAGRD